MQIEIFSILDIRPEVQDVMLLDKINLLIQDIHYHVVEYLTLSVAVAHFYNFSVW